MESKTQQAVRAAVVSRDGYCRYYKAQDWDTIVECDGPSEWAHLGDKKRARTRNMAPEVRHTTAGSLMLCRRHHQQYDSGEIVILGTDANGPLAFYQKGAVHAAE